MSEAHRVEVLGDNLILRPARFDPKLQTVARSLPGTRRWMKGQLVVAPTHANMATLASLLPGAEWSEEAQAMFFGEEERIRQAVAARAREPGEEARTFQFKVQPFAHQLKAWEVSKDAEAFAYLMEMGTGKTKLALDVGAYLFLKSRIDLILVVAPNGVHTQWVEQAVPAHLPDDIPRSSFVLRTGMGALPVIGKTLDAVERGAGLKICAINAEALSYAHGERLVERLLKGYRALLIIDEASMFKTPGAARTKALLRVKKHARFRRILDGTPVSSGVEDLFAPFKFLDERIIGTGSFLAFKSEFCITGGYEGREIVGYKNLEVLQDRIRPYSFAVKKKDCLDLPPKVYSEREFILSEEERARFNHMRDELLAWVDMEQKTGAVTAVHGAAKLTKLQQISSGFLVGEDGEVVWRASKPTRLATFLELVDELHGQPALVFVQYREEIRQILEALAVRKIKASPCSGGQSAADRDRSVAKFKNGETQFFVAQYQAGGVGLDLPNARYTFYYSHTPVARLRWQSEDRNHRPGQTESVLYTDLIGRGSVDRRWKRVVEKRGDIASMTLDDLREMLSSQDAPDSL